jgi:aminomuconate-semialdehyde/2-hydroxymuconate-6-semialdehyde dehydrogenase
MGAASATLKKVSFELGGKGASVVFADADRTAAVQTVCRAAFRNQGQICLAGSRLLVQEEIADQFVKDLIVATQAIVVGDPLVEATTMGALISLEHRDRVQAFVSLAVQEGAKILVGGSVPADLPALGAYFSPTIISDVKQESRLIQEEIFGPILTVQTFSDEADALTKLNGTAYGLSCSVWSEDAGTLERMSRGARMGLVWQNCWFLRNLNTPFGGMKASGIGREGGLSSFNFFAEQKTITRPKG